MSEISYPRIIQEALRGVVTRVLSMVAEEGLPGEHYFYISFRTGHPEVRVPPFLRDQYPDEMSIVLQNQFWDLEVDAEGFSVTLSFNATRHRLTVPLAAVTAFVDPTAEFGLRFDGSPAEPPAPEPGTPAPEEPPRPAGGGSGEVVRFQPRRRK